MLKLIIGDTVFITDPTDLGGDQSLGEVLQVGNDAGGAGIINLLSLFIGSGTDDGTTKLLQSPSLSIAGGIVTIDHIGNLTLLPASFGQATFDLLNTDASPGVSLGWIPSFNCLTVSDLISQQIFAVNRDTHEAFFGTLAGDASSATISLGGVNHSLAGIDGLGNMIATTYNGVTPIADGIYTLGLGVNSNGTITTEFGFITAITEAS